jgi:DNA helicase IV
VGDGPLVAALSSARTGRMREAAATLQTEQDEIVRSPHRGIMVVDGGPGTGKTIVALHRAAYVLYEFPSIADRGVLVYGPNRRFLTYITDVLPSLGENDVRLATLPDLVGIEAPRSEPDDLAQIKGRAQFAGVLAHWVQAREPQGIPLEVRTAHGTVILDSDLVDAARRSAVQDDIGHNPARELFTERIVDELVNELEQQTARELSDFEADLKTLQGIDLDRMFANGSHSTGSDDANPSADGLEIDWDRIRDELLDDASIDRIISGVWPRLRAEDAVRGVLTDRATLARALPDVAAEQLTRMGDLNGIDWSNADLALLDEARALIDGPPHDVFGHMVVDEAQQLTQMQWRTLMRRCPSRSMTIVGDLAQTGPTTTIRTWNDALQPFVSDRFAHHTLTINYRTTEEILHTTEPLLARIAPEQRLSRSIRHGEHPTSATVTEVDIASKLVELIASTQEKHPGELIGIITTTQRSISLNTKLSETGYTMIAAPDARGLEFDTVIIVDPDDIQHASTAGLRDLYVAQTRATKRLITLTIAPT